VPKEAIAVRLKYFGHSSFLVEAADGTKIVIDPYISGSFDGGLTYSPIDEPADVVVASHTHDDHGGTDTVPGHPLVLIHPTRHSVGGVEITGVQVAHDEEGGRKRGQNTIIILDDGELRLVHLGDLGHPLDPATVQTLGRVDVLLVPVGGFFTIDQHVAAQVVDTLNPRVVVPMHYKTSKANFPIVGVEPFLATQKTVKRVPGSTVELTKDALPAEPTVIVLDHAN
jgi:L-ascorbate metabolism protein UlaG (beta-lactamase superfamily)